MFVGTFGAHAVATFFAIMSWGVGTGYVGISHASGFHGGDVHVNKSKITHIIHRSIPSGQP